MKSIGFIGLGLIGGSIAKAIHQYHPEIKLYGHATRLSTLQEAAGEKVIVNNDFLPLESFAAMDIIFLCAPVTSNIEYLKKLAPLISGDCLITDIGSVKGNIDRAAKELGLSHCFIGGHPMTGSEKDGYSNSSPLLLENAYYILTKNDSIDEMRFKSFKDFISSLGAITLMTEPSMHDHATAAISHLPHIIAASLVRFVRDSDNSDGFMRTIAAGGFKDITRIASSSPVMWQNICIDNRDELLTAMEHYEESLAKAREMIKRGDSGELMDFFREAKDYRDSLPLPGGRQLSRSHDFFIDLEDEVGQIATVATTLSESGLNIKNIGIIHNREFHNGVLHLDMYDDRSRAKAIELLGKSGFHIYDHK